MCARGTHDIVGTLTAKCNHDIVGISRFLRLDHMIFGPVDFEIAHDVLSASVVRNLTKTAHDVVTIENYRG